MTQTPHALGHSTLTFAWMAESLLKALPELVVLVRRDGTVLSSAGGDGLGRLACIDAVGRRIGDLWPPEVAELVRTLLRRALVNRSHAEARFRDEEREFEVRISAQGPDRAMCVIRPARPRLQLGRAEFLAHFRKSVSEAALRGTPLAAALIHINGLPDVRYTTPADISARPLNDGLRRLRVEDTQISWKLGQLGASLLAVVLDSADRASIDTCLVAICTGLREPGLMAEIERLPLPSVGVAILGPGCLSPRALLELARASLTEGRIDNRQRRA